MSEKVKMTENKNETSRKLRNAIIDFSAVERKVDNNNNRMNITNL